jgi:hypothetical protein
MTYDFGIFILSADNVRGLVTFIIGYMKTKNSVLQVL